MKHAGIAYSLFALATLATSAGCGSTDGISPTEGTDESSQEVIARARPRTVELSYTFDKSDEGFETIFADYPAGSETFYELASGSAPIPDVGGTGMMLAGTITVTTCGCRSRTASARAKASSPGRSTT